MSRSRAPAETRRVGLVVPAISGGGAERVLVWLANEWAAAGHEVQFVTLKPDAADYYVTSPQVQRVRVRPSANAWYQLRRHLLRARAVRRWITAFRPQAIVSFLPKANITVLLAAWGLRTPVVVSERTSFDRKDVPVWRRVLRWLIYRRASVLVVFTRRAAGSARRLLPPSRIRLIPNPLIARRPGGTTVGSDPSSRIILSMGRLEWVKGFDRLIEAFARASARIPGWRLRIFGDGTERDRLAARAAAAGVGQLVELPGRTTDPMARMAEAAVFILSSRYEGFGNVLIEAMSCGLCVIAFDCPEGPAEIIAHGRDGVLVPDGDLDGLARAIERVCLDSAERHRLGRKAGESASRFDPGRVLSLWDSLLHDVTGAAR